MLLAVRCPKCGSDQKYQPQGGEISKKVKKCVYCGCSFKVHSCLPKSRITMADSSPYESGFATATIPRKL